MGLKNLADTIQLATGEFSRKKSIKKNDWKTVIICYKSTRPRALSRLRERKREKERESDQLLWKTRMNFALKLFGFLSTP